MSHEEYYKQIEAIASQMGYTKQQVEMFRVDIMEQWADGTSVEEAVEIIF